MKECIYLKNERRKTYKQQQKTNEALMKRMAWCGHYWFNTETLSKRLICKKEKKSFFFLVAYVNVIIKIKYHTIIKFQWKNNNKTKQTKLTIKKTLQL